jgi:hypothetical protein
MPSSPTPILRKNITTGHGSDTDGEVIDGKGDKNRRITVHSRTRHKAEVEGIIERANERHTRKLAGHVGDKVNRSTPSQDQCEAIQNELTAGRTPSQGLM